MARSPDRVVPFAAIEHDGTPAVTPDGWLVRLMPYPGNGTADIASLWEEWSLDGWRPPGGGGLHGGARSVRSIWPSPEVDPSRWPVVTLEHSSDNGAHRTVLDAGRVGADAEE